MIAESAQIQANTQEDLWGRICMDYFEKGHADFVMRRDDGRAEEMDAASFFRTDLVTVEVGALNRTRGHVLDVGCGPGADVLWLQAHGSKVTGIDASRGAIDVARRRGASDVHVLSCWDIDQLGAKFDSVLLFGNNLGLAGTLDDTPRFLELLREHTNSGAVLIGQTMNPSVTTEENHLAYHRRNEAAGRYCGQVRIREEYEGRIAPWFEWVFFEAEVLAPLLAQHGWLWLDTIRAGRTYVVVAKRS